MSGYAGTDEQRLLQQRAEAALGWAASTPGACNASRFLGVDDPDRLGWATIFDLLDRDGVLGFRLLDGQAAETVSRRLAARGYRIDFWDVFLAGKEQVLSASAAILAQGLPEGCRLTGPMRPDDLGRAAQLQTFLLAHGIAPFAASILTGAAAPATTWAILDPDDAIVASAHGYRPHNAFSPRHGWSWGGLVAVAPAHRGRGLATVVNARMARSCFEDLGAEAIYELVAPTNAPSRRMVERCGLALEPDLKCGIATKGAARFTR